MASSFSRYINYLREAFYNPVHLIGLGIASLVTIALGTFLFMTMNISPIFLGFALVGIEFLYLGFASRNERFMRAVNSRYANEIESFEKAKSVTQYFNQLSAPRQRRFEHFKTMLNDVKEDYARIHDEYPDVINKFIAKVSNLQLTYSRLLFMQDRFPAYLENENPDTIKAQIDELKNEMAADSPKLKDIKMKRVKLMEKRIHAYGKAMENKEIVSAQLQTMEEMVQYIKDQPVALKNLDGETSIIDNILAETENMESTISDLEAVMNSNDIPSIGDYGDMGLEDLSTSGEEAVKS